MINKLYNTRKEERGFTIIETLITVVAAMIMFSIVDGIFANTIRIERRASAAQKIQENAMYIFESMTKEIRISTLSNQDTASCTAVGAATTLTMTHPVNGSVTYTLSGTSVLRQGQAINTSDVIFNYLRFCITGSSSTPDGQSPKVTILASISNSSVANPITVNLQTTITSRNVSTEFSQ